MWVAVVIVGNLLSPGFKSVSYAYDSHNRVTVERMGDVSASPLQSAYGYDVAGNRTLARFATGSALVSTFDALNRSIRQDEAATTPGSPLVPLVQPLVNPRRSTWEFDLAGRIHAQNLANGTRIENTHDAQGRLRTRSLLGLAPSSGPRFVLGQQTYLYDASANLRQMVETSSVRGGTRTVSMTYDASLRLDVETIREADNTLVTSDYDYDAVGNRTKLTRTTSGQPAPVVSNYTYNALNQLTGFSTTGAGAVSYTYDANGNRLSRSQGSKLDTYTWDALNRLVKVVHPEANGTSKAYRYAYDYRDRRVLRQEGAETTLLAFSGGTSVAELSTTGMPATQWSSAGSITFTLAKTYVRGSDMGGGVGGLLYSEKPTAALKPSLTVFSFSSLLGSWNTTGALPVTVSPSFNHYNGRGDVVAKTDASGGVTWTGAYEAFGKRTRETGTNEDRQRANTKDEDPTGLLNEGHRYRDLETGTWLSRDPAGFVDGPNLYAYVRANPWTKFDPTGLFLLSMDDKTKQIVTNVRNADPRLNQIVTELEKSPYPFKIESNLGSTGEKGSFSPGAQDPLNSDRIAESRLLRETDRYNGKGMGGRIQTMSEARADGKTPEQTMAHELGHAFDCNRGITPTKTQAELGIIGKNVPKSKLMDVDENENRAVRTENIYNSAKDIALRTTYPITGDNNRSKEEVPNPDGANAPVSTEPKDGAPHLRQASSASNPSQTAPSSTGTPSQAQPAGESPKADKPSKEESEGDDSDE